MANTEVLFDRGSKEYIDSLPKVDGKIMFTTDQDENMIYTDVAKQDGTVKRIAIGGSGDKMNKVNPAGSGSFSLNRRTNTTIGSESFAEGYWVEASGARSHAEGSLTKAKSFSSHAEGDSTIASGRASHAEGDNTIAAGINSHAEGKFNIEDTENKYAHIIGNGTDKDNRSNALTVDWNGNLEALGTICGKDGLILNDWKVKLNLDCPLVGGVGKDEKIELRGAKLEFTKDLDYGEGKIASVKVTTDLLDISNISYEWK